MEVLVGIVLPTFLGSRMLGALGWHSFTYFSGGCLVAYIHGSVGWQIFTCFSGLLGSLGLRICAANALALSKIA